MEFNIGERVVVKDYDDIPEQGKTKRYWMFAGKEGEIVDKIYSEAKGITLYRVHFDGYDKPSVCNFLGCCFDLVRDESEYTYEFEYLENLVVARLYEIKNGEKVEIAKGHGHIFHDGVYGVAQAASYALKRICDDLNGGSLKVWGREK